MYLEFLKSQVYNPSSFTIMRKRELVALLGLSSWHLVIVLWLFLAVPWVCLQFVIVYFFIILTIFNSALIGSNTVCQ